MPNVFDARGRAPQFPQRRAMIRGRGLNPFAHGGRVPGYDFGGIFNSQPGSSTTTQSSSTTSGPTDSGYNSLRDNVLGFANWLLSNQQFRKYQGPNGETNPIVGLDPNQQKAISAANSNVGSYQPFFNAANQTLTNTNQGIAGKTFPDVMQQYMSPYTGSVVKGIQDASNRNFEQNTLRSINDVFSGGNAASFGREQHGNAVGNAVFAKTQADDQAVANALESGYTTAGNLFNADAMRAGNLGLNTANAQAQLGQFTQGAGINDINSLLTTGATGQNTAQNQSNFNYNQWQQGINFPWQQLANAQAVSQGWQLPMQSNTTSTGTSTVQPPSGSIAGQILGGGLGIASLFTGGGNSAINGIKNFFSRDGGYVEPAYAQGGMVPTVSRMRKNAMVPKGMPTGMPQMPPMGPQMPMPQMAAPPIMSGGPGKMPRRNQMPYASGGPVNDQWEPPAMAPLSYLPIEQPKQDSGGGGDLFGTLLKLAPMLMARDGGAVNGYDDGGPFKPADEPRPTSRQIQSAMDAAYAMRGFKPHWQPEGSYDTPRPPSEQSAAYPRWADGGMFLNASDNAATADPGYEMQRRRPLFGDMSWRPGNDEDRQAYINAMEPSGRDRVMRDDPLLYLWRHLPQNVRDMGSFARDMMPDRAIEQYLNSSRDLARSMFDARVGDSLENAGDAGLAMMGMFAPGAARGARAAFNPLVERMVR